MSHLDFAERVLVADEDNYVEALVAHLEAVRELIGVSRMVRVDLTAREGTSYAQHKWECEVHVACRDAEAALGKAADMLAESRRDWLRALVKA